MLGVPVAPPIFVKDTLYEHSTHKRIVQGSCWKLAH